MDSFHQFDKCLSLSYVSGNMIDMFDKREKQTSKILALKEFRF
jgi:hypothetical protein